MSQIKLIGLQLRLINENYKDNKEGFVSHLEKLCLTKQLDLQLPFQNNIVIKNGRSDVLTQQWGGILATYEGQITLDNTTQFIGNIQSNQGTLSFDAKVNGWVDNGLIKLNAEVHDLFVEYKNATFRRGKGDISFD